MKSLMLLSSFILIAPAQAAKQLYHCDTMGGPSKEALVSIEVSGTNQVNLEVKLLANGNLSEEMDAVFVSDHIGPNGGIASESEFKVQKTSESIPAWIQGSITPDQAAGKVHLGINAGWDHRIERGFGLHLACTSL